MKMCTPRERAEVIVNAICRLSGACDLLVNGQLTLEAYESLKITSIDEIERNLALGIDYSEYYTNDDA